MDDRQQRFREELLKKQEDTKRGYNAIQLICIISIETFVYSRIKTIYKLIFTLDFIYAYMYTDIK